MVARQRLGRGGPRQDAARAARGRPARTRVPRHPDPAARRAAPAPARRRLLERQSADDRHLPGPETSGTSFFAFGTAYAVRAGLVDRAAYLPVAARAWNGMVSTAVHPDGFLATSRTSATDRSPASPSRTTAPPTSASEAS
ncbi:glycoside hydrolase family 88 protein [Streptomyces sp. M19]